VISPDGDQFITRNKQLQLNLVVQNIALIGSPKSEGYTDFIHTVQSNQYGYKFSIDNYYSAVQGVGAEQELVKTLVQVYHDHAEKKYDCVVIIRGGGSRTDFLVFDTYSLARAAARFPIPIISGIGHHKDVSILDLMVHTQTKTPTKAAEFIISQNRTFEDRVLILQRSVIIRTQQLLAARTQQINLLNTAVMHQVKNALAGNKDFLVACNHIIVYKARQTVLRQQQLLMGYYHKFTSVPAVTVAKKQGDLAHLAGNIRSYSNKYLGNQQGYLEHVASIVRIMSPQNILRKGFAMISQNNKIVVNTKEIEIGSAVTITMNEADITAQVLSKNEHHGKFNV
jgi:exodeoxyribonuclease VII large subunit